MNDLPDPIPAATLVLMRKAQRGASPQILMMERTANMAFAAGALVFPGGRSISNLNTIFPESPKY